MRTLNRGTMSLIVIAIVIGIIAAISLFAAGCGNADKKSLPAENGTTEKENAGETIASKTEPAENAPEPEEDEESEPLETVPDETGITGDPAASDDIREAVFRSLFAKNASGMKANAKGYYITIEKADPSPEFLGRFEGNSPPVKKGSHATSNKSEGVVDKVTGERGLRFGAGRIEWLSETHVRLDATYYEAGLSAAGYTFELKLISDKWTVINRKMNWIS